MVFVFGLRALPVCSVNSLSCHVSEHFHVSVIFIIFYNILLGNDTSTSAIPSHLKNV